VDIVEYKCDFQLLSCLSFPLAVVQAELSYCRGHQRNGDLWSLQLPLPHYKQHLSPAC